jgi:hypothetical protein
MHCVASALFLEHDGAEEEVGHHQDTDADIAECPSYDNAECCTQTLGEWPADRGRRRGTLAVVMATAACSRRACRENAGLRRVKFFLRNVLTTPLGSHYTVLQQFFKFTTIFAKSELR